MTKRQEVSEAKPYIGAICQYEHCPWPVIIAKDGQIMTVINIWEDDDQKSTWLKSLTYHQECYKEFLSKNGENAHSFSGEMNRLFGYEWGTSS